MQRRILLVALASAGCLSLAGCAQSLTKDLPPGENGLLKRFKARVNMQVAKLDLGFKNISSLSLIVKDNPNRAQIARGDYNNLEKAYKELQDLAENIPMVRESVVGEDVLAAFDDYAAALKVITDNPMGEIDQDRINAMLKAAAALEPVVD